MARLIDELRRVQDAVAKAHRPEEVLDVAARRLSEAYTAVAPYAVPEADRLVGRRYDLPGRGQAMVPPLTILEGDDQHVVAHVVCGPYYLGLGGAAHGGVPALIFDEALGRLANTGGRSASRTAYLHVNYRSIARIGAQLLLEGHVDREEGRKRWLSGRLTGGETLVADAEGLFVGLRPGQP
jgi:acyl-coenzyme A thioesterase PaaI-like protein